MRSTLTRCTALALVAVLLAACPAAAKPLATSGSNAVVTSVDGPAELTVKIGRRTLPVRLTAVDTPRAGECGAIQTTTALAGFVRRAPKRLKYSLVVNQERVVQRDADGRFPISLGYRVRRDTRDFGSDLIRAGWARSGGPAMLDARADWDSGLASDDATAKSDDQSYDDSGMGLFGPTGPRRGMWIACGGRLHLAASAPVPATAAATWQVNEFGVTERIGTLELPATQSPETSLTIRRLSELVPVELTRGSLGPCTAWIPSLQVQAWTFELDDPAATCGDTTVHMFLTSGPDPAALSRGGGVGQPRAATSRAYPRSLIGRNDAGALDGEVEEEYDDDFLLLPGPGHTWAWQTAVDIGAKGSVTELLTYASPGPLDN